MSDVKLTAEEKEAKIAEYKAAIDSWSDNFVWHRYHEELSRQTRNGLRHISFTTGADLGDGSPAPTMSELVREALLLMYIIETPGLTESLDLAKLDRDIVQPPIEDRGHLCEDCGANLLDSGQKACSGCVAYNEHTGQI